MRCSYYPKVLFESVGRIGRSGIDFGGVDPPVPIGSSIPSCPGTTSLTDDHDQSDRCDPFVEFVSCELLDSSVFRSCWCWSVLGRFGGVLLDFVKSSSLQVVFWGCFCSRA
jgi:hypothetical protein